MELIIVGSAIIIGFSISSGCKDIRIGLLELARVILVLHNDSKPRPTGEGGKV